MVILGKINMTLAYQNIEGLQPGTLLEEVLDLNRKIFGDSKDRVLAFAEGKKDFLMTIATLNGKVVGYKLGYQEKPSRFYSWLGGVDPEQRGKGIGSKLMELQHSWCKEHGYVCVQTRTKNKWKHMLILNLKNGFDVIGTYTDSRGEPKIILEKKL